jgi:hypothetical protein
MKPYHKLIQPKQSSGWQGHFNIAYHLIVTKQKPKIPLRFFSNVNPTTEERKKWLQCKVAYE